MTRTSRIVLVVLGVLAFAVGAACAFGALRTFGVHPGTAVAWGFVGFGFWLASTLP